MVSLPITTERLELRELVTDDLARHHELFSEPSVVRYLYEEPLDFEQAEAHLATRLNPTLPPDEGRWVNLAVTQDRRFLGEVGATIRDVAHRQCEVGYIFLPLAWGSGFATEAAAAMVMLCFEAFKAHRVAARLDARNDASAGVARRLGMRQEAHFRENEFIKGEWVDEAVFAMTEDEWHQHAHNHPYPPMGSYAF